MSAEVLRQAADRLDALTITTEAMGDPWLDEDTLDDLTDGNIGGEDGAYIAAMSPTVGQALARWLRHQAGVVAEVEAMYGPAVRECPALAVARAILEESA